MPVIARSLRRSNPVRPRDSTGLLRSARSDEGPLSLPPCRLTNPPMRPDILNPLFAEVEVLKGIGPGLARPLKRLGLERVVDILFHLPPGGIERKRVDVLDVADAGRVVTLVVTPVDYRQSGGRGPVRVYATDRKGNYITLTYFHNPGWAKKQLPLGEPKIVSGRMESYGQELQMVHPDYVLEPGEALDLPEREAVYPLSEGLTNRRMGDLAGQALARVPKLGEWIEPSLIARRGWPGWQEALAGGPRAPRAAGGGGGPSCGGFSQ